MKKKLVTALSYSLIVQIKVTLHLNYQYNILSTSLRKLLTLVQPNKVSSCKLNRPKHQRHVNLEYKNTSLYKCAQFNV